MKASKFRNFIVKNKNSILVIAVILIFLSLWFGSSIFEALRLIQLKRDLTNQIVERQEVNSQLDEDIAQIGSQSYIERIARQYLELYYPDEEIVIPVENKIQAETSNENNSSKENISEDIDYSEITPPQNTSNQTENTEETSEPTEEINNEETDTDEVIEE